MAVISDNDKGNKYHSEKDGKFVSKNDVGSNSDSNVANKIRLKPGVDLSQIGAKAPNIKLKGNISIDAISEKFRDLNQLINIPRLTSARDIENHISEFFSKQVTTKIDELYGSAPDLASYQFHPKANPRMILEIFPNVLGKYRYKDNHAKVVNSFEFNKLLRDSSFMRGKEQIYRGMSSTGQKATDIVNNYGTLNLDSFDYYCPNSGNCYGSNVYTTVDYNYAYDYANYGRGTLINGILDSTNSWHMSYNSVYGIMSQIDSNKVYNDVAKQLEKNGLALDRAQRIAKSFSKAIKVDTGIVAICMGLDYYIASGHQRNLFNLTKWTIREV